MEAREELPSFLIVGAAKCGTTSLHHYLMHSGMVEMPRMKETHFFADEVLNCNASIKSGPYGSHKIVDIEKYKSLFSSSKGVIRGETCVSYLYFFKQSVKKIKQILGDPKIIILLRNPLERSFSNYMHHVRDGFEKLSYDQALAQIDNRKEDKWWWGYDYVGGSLYFNTVKYYLENFSHVKILFFEDFKECPLNTLEEIHRFLDIPYQDIIYKNLNLSEHNKSYVPKFPFIMRLLKRYRAMRLSMHYAKKVLYFLPIESCLISNHKISDTHPSIDLHKIFYEDAQKLGDLINVNLMEKWFKR